MKRILFFATLLGLIVARLAAAEEAATQGTSSRMKEILRVRASEEAKKQRTLPAKPPPAPAPAPTPASVNQAATPPATDASVANAPAPASVAATPATPAAASEPETPAKPIDSTAPAKETEIASKDSPTMLPQVDVRKRRITELDIKLHEQAKEIRREEKNTKPTELDDALNNPKVSKVFAIFGGESSKHRSAISQERVELMEAESDLIEAIAQAPTPAEKAELEKQLDQLKAYRRELEKALR